MFRPGSITLTVDPTRIRGTAQTATARGLVGAASVLVGYIKDTFTRTGGPASRPGTPPAVQQGTLRKNVAMTRPQGGVIYVHTSGNAYARMQEYGGTIRARTKQYLAVPLGAAARRIRRDAKDTLLNSDRNLFVIKSRRGNLILMERHGKRGTVTPRFVLKKSVVLKARPFMRPAIASRTVRKAMTTAFAEKSVRDFRRLVER
jgi:hypothetical protein